MAEFLQSYGIWVVLGLFLLIMLVRRRRGGCCGGGGHQHDSVQNTSEGKQDQHKHSGGCH